MSRELFSSPFSNREIVSARANKAPLEWEPIPETATEITRERLEVYRQLLEEKSVPGWTLVEVGQSGSHGASAYGYFFHEGVPGTLTKIRISDHAYSASS